MASRPEVVPGLAIRDGRGLCAIQVIVTAPLKIVWQYFSLLTICPLHIISIVN